MEEIEKQNFTSVNGQRDFALNSKTKSVAHIWTPSETLQPLVYLLVRDLF